MKKIKIILLLIFALLVMILLPITISNHAERSFMDSLAKTDEECKIIETEEEQEIECTKINEKPIPCENDVGGVCIFK